jgi:hypothetical protein
VFDNRVLRRIFEPKRERVNNKKVEKELYDEGLHLLK